MDNTERIRGIAREAVAMIEDRLPLMVLTGAGISVESRVPPFRGPGGLWERYDPYDHGHIDSFKRDPERSWKMLREILDGAVGSEPNKAHLSLSRLERMGYVTPVVTQNIDGLHRDAGTENLLEVHGNARRVICPSCGRREDVDSSNLKQFSIHCVCGTVKRPDIIFFGEQLPEKEVEEAFDLAYGGVSMLVVGTSGIVQPMAMLPGVAKQNGGRIIEINPYPSELTNTLTDVLLDVPATVGMMALEAALIRHFS